MGAKNTGGTWENLARMWLYPSKAATPTFKTRDYGDDVELVIYGPDDKPLKRVVDTNVRIGFRNGR
jgi:hypothetical protein